jgi:hypothetical protein
MSSSWRLTAGETYRIAYGVGGSADRRITRSVVVYSGEGERRRWDGRLVRCLEFALPRGRMLSLLEEQLVDARPARAAPPDPAPPPATLRRVLAVPLGVSIDLGLR